MISTPRLGPSLPSSSAPLDGVATPSVFTSAAYFFNNSTEAERHKHCEIRKAALQEPAAIVSLHRHLMTLRRIKKVDEARRHIKAALAVYPYSAILRNDQLTVAPVRDDGIEEQLVTDIQALRLQPTSCAFNLCIYRAACTGRLTDALAYLVIQHQYGLRPDFITCRYLQPIFESLEALVNRPVRRRPPAGVAGSVCGLQAGAMAHAVPYGSTEAAPRLNMQFIHLLGADLAGYQRVSRSYWSPAVRHQWTLRTRRQFFEATLRHDSAQSSLAAHTDYIMHGGHLDPADLCRLVQRWHG